MDESTLLKLWNEPESEHIEWKPSFSQTHSIYKTICAFANDLFNTQRPGVIFIGRENDGRCSNKVFTDKDGLDFVQELRSGSILPLPDISYKLIELESCQVVALIVHPSHSTPVQYGRDVYIRQGPSSNRARAEEITSLTERRISRSFDGRAVNGATYEQDIDLFYVQEEYIPNAVSKEILDENGRELREKLSALRILTPQFNPTALGILVSGKDARRFLPGAYVQFLRIDGMNHGDPVKDSSEISGRVSDILLKCFDKIQAHIEVSHTFNHLGQRIEHRNYPFEALRELIANAIVHRDYERSNAPVRITWFDDRIEIHNPGGPYGHVTEQNFGQPQATDYRNPELAAALKYLGFVEKFGSGIARVKQYLERNGNPEIVFEPRQSDNYVLVTVRPA